MKGKAIPYSPAEMAWLEANHSLAIGDYHAAFVAAFGRFDVTAANLNSLRERQGWKTGRTGRFDKGAVPFNKGQQCLPGQGGRHPNSRKTQFQAGTRQGVAVRLYKPIGTERISKDGYRERKIHDGMPLQSRWRAVHLLNWEAENGPVPKGMALKCVDGDRSNVATANWIAISRSLLPRLAGGRHKKLVAYDQAAPELRPAILAAAQLDHMARKRKSV